MTEGPAERAFHRGIRRAAAPTRIATTTPAALSALLVVPPARLPETAVVVAVLLAWSVLTVPAQRRGDTRMLAADVVLLSGLCLLQPRLEVPLLAGNECGWIQMFVEVCMVCYTWQFRRRAALTAAAILIAAYVAGALRTPGAEPALIAAFAVWLLVCCLASRYIFESLVRTSRQIDRAKAASEKEQRRIEVARAVRDAQAEHLATLHDTVAATLLMVGLGGAGADPEVLRRQARRDLAVLATADRGTGTSLDLRLREVVAESGLEVSLSGASPAVLPAVTVDSFAGAVGEALRNVARHAGTDRAAVHVHAEAGAVRVEVLDGGRGFAEGARHGHGIRQSIIGRMERCGGSASVLSSAGGVLVALEWREPVPA